MIITPAMVLRNYPIGEIHKGVVLFTPRFGLLNAIAHGAQKSAGKLAAATRPYCKGKAYLYHNPVKKSFTVKDFAVEHYFTHFHESLEKSFAAGLWTELVIKSYAGGEHHSSFFNFIFFFFLKLDEYEKHELATLMVQFLWHFLAITGFSPDLHTCGRCGRSIIVEAPVYYSQGGMEFLCKGCGDGSAEKLSLGAKKYLLHTAFLPYSQALAVRLGSESMTRLKKILFHYVQGTIEVPLKSLTIGGDYL